MFTLPGSPLNSVWNAFEKQRKPRTQTKHHTDGHLYWAVQEYGVWTLLLIDATVLPERTSGCHSGPIDGDDRQYCFVRLSPTSTTKPSIEATTRPGAVMEDKLQSVKVQVTAVTVESMSAQSPKGIIRAFEKSYYPGIWTTQRHVSSQRQLMHVLDEGCRTALSE